MHLATACRTTLLSFLELVYPALCAACNEPRPEPDAFCALCSLSLEPIVHPCSMCGFPLPQPAPRCLRCLTTGWSFASAQAPFEYGGALGDAIRRLKWTGTYELARPLGRLLANSAHGLKADLLIPVPLHPKRLRQRGYNQAALLALRVGRQWRIGVDTTALHRSIHTQPQSRLQLSDRYANVKGAFFAHPKRVQGKRVILLDDVMTSGATLEACAHSLQQAGAVWVVALTLARAVP